MESSIDELGKLKYSIALEISFQEMKPTYDAVYRELKKTRHNGFRQGKHPKGWLDKRFNSVMHAEAVEEFWPEMKFDTAKDVQDSIALLNFYRYILKEGFTKFLAHDIGADGKGIGNYVYAEGDAMQMTLELMRYFDLAN